MKAKRGTQAGKQAHKRGEQRKRRNIVRKNRVEAERLARQGRSPLPFLTPQAPPELKAEE